MSEFYPNTLVPRIVRDFDGSFSLVKSDLQRLYKCVNKDSSPGFPWARFGLTKKEVYDNADDFLLEALNHRLNLLASDQPLPVSDEERLVHGWVDPVRVFVKDEPHSLEKIKTGRFRIICSVSFLDELVDKVLFEPQNKKEIENWDVCPSKPGLGLSTKTQLERVHGMFQGNRLGSDTLLFSDMSGYDWVQKKYMFEMDLEFRRRKLVGLPEHKKLWHHMASRRYEFIVQKVWSLSNGLLYHQSHPGILPSGWANTSSTNSRGRLLIAIICGSLFACTMGDDAGEWLLREKMDEILTNYSEYGFKLKPSYTVDPETDFKIDFCSHSIYKTDRVYAEPLNWAKITVKYLQNANPHDPEKYAELMENLRDLDQASKSKVENLVKQLRLEFPINLAGKGAINGEN